MDQQKYQVIRHNEYWWVARNVPEDEYNQYYKYDEEYADRIIECGNKHLLLLSKYKSFQKCVTKHIELQPYYQFNLKINKSAVLSAQVALITLLLFVIIK